MVRVALKFSKLTAIELGKAEVVAEIKPVCDEQITIWWRYGCHKAAEQFTKHDVGVRVVNMR